jgi:hypothetical protein
VPSTIAWRVSGDVEVSRRRPEAGRGDPRLPAASARMGCAASSCQPTAGGPGTASYEWGWSGSQVRSRRLLRRAAANRTRA